MMSERFWGKVQRGDGCWLWLAGVSARGYGRFHVAGVGARPAHRISWELTYGYIPDGYFACHRCDNRRCVRPDHLFLGTARDNTHDAVHKGRMSVPHRGKISREDRLAIYAMSYRRGLNAELAQRYGVSKQAISKIRGGEFVGSGTGWVTKTQIQVSHGL